MEFRTEHDSLGEVSVPADKYFGAQTQRSFQNFKIGTEKMPQELIRALAILKACCAKANLELVPEKMTAERCKYISLSCEKIIGGELWEHFPLSVWQTGSGTQTNMNVNEVVANLGNAEAGKVILHPNDHVNMSQSSNDIFPSAMHLCAVTEIERNLLPAIDGAIAHFVRIEGESEGIIKTGRTHLQDATPVKFSQEVSGWRGMLEASRAQIVDSLRYLRPLAVGGTATGTGINAPKGFGRRVAELASEYTKTEFYSEENKFHALSSKDALAFSHSALCVLAGNCLKIANDIRHLASGPRCGLCEIKIPENEPGSSIMPGKVNPTQCEALSMVALQVMGNDTTVKFASSQGNFQLNVYMPLIIYNFLQSVRLLSDALCSFGKNCLAGLVANREKMDENLKKSLMTVTALNPYIGYENSAKVAKRAYAEGLTLKESALSLGFLTEEEFDRIFDYGKMV